MRRRYNYWVTNLCPSLSAAKIQAVDTAFESSEFRQLVLEATDDSLNRALDLFNVPGGVDVNLRGRPFVQADEEVGIH